VSRDVTEHNHILRNYGRSKQIKHKYHTTVNVIKLKNIFYSCVLWKQQSLLKMLSQYKTTNLQLVWS